MLQQGDEVERRLCLPNSSGEYAWVWVRCGFYSGPYPDHEDLVLVYHGSIGGFAQEHGPSLHAPEPERLLEHVGTPYVSVVSRDDLRLYVRPRRWALSGPTTC